MSINTDPITVAFPGSGKEPKRSYKSVHSVLKGEGDVRYIAPEDIYSPDASLIPIRDSLEHRSRITVLGESAGGIPAYVLATLLERDGRSVRLLGIDVPAGHEYLKDEHRKGMEAIRDLEAIPDEVLLEWRAKNTIPKPPNLRHEDLTAFQGDMQARSTFPLHILGAQGLRLARHRFGSTKLSPRTPFIHLVARRDFYLDQASNGLAWKEEVPHVEELVVHSPVHAGLTARPAVYRQAIFEAYRRFDELEGTADLPTASGEFPQ